MKNTQFVNALSIRGNKLELEIVKKTYEKYRKRNKSGGY